MQDPSRILEKSFERARTNIAKPIIQNQKITNKVELVSRNIKNRACIRLVLSCLLAKVHRPEVDVRKPYTEIGGVDSFSGRTYDESYISEFVKRHELPCNPTTAFLTPALRNMNTVLTPDIELEGRPKEVYTAALELLEEVYKKKVSADDLLAECVRSLIIFRDERQERMTTLMGELKTTSGAVPLSAEEIITLIQQHLKCRGSSRLPVLVVAAAYKAAQNCLGERALALKSHNAADEQTGALGDVEITLVNDDNVITSYEMKMRRVTRLDLDRAIQKIKNYNGRIDNYIFITTEAIDQDVQDYAKTLYDNTGGIEFVVLDCIGFTRHFLHLFHRLRISFLDSYQILLLAQSDSAVRQELKEAFLSLRRAAESGEQ